MEFIGILMGLGGVLGWGLFGSMGCKFGGGGVNEMFGGSVGTLMLGIVVGVFKGIGLGGGMGLVFWVI
ncbi:hypothetical protein [Staphylococcus epidermidis]|uniref:hypothetical protein n=1 Tax=Staphylococcus epidermidis TaxID=1282 RepID=UPI00119D8930|nr:hypothetical protein [Staphylococcus epidermidis]